MKTIVVLALALYCQIIFAAALVKPLAETHQKQPKYNKELLHDIKLILNFKKLPDRLKEVIYIFLRELAKEKTLMMGEHTADDLCFSLDCKKLAVSNKFPAILIFDVTTGDLDQTHGTQFFYKIAKWSHDSSQLAVYKDNDINEIYVLLLKNKKSEPWLKKKGMQISNPIDFNDDSIPELIKRHYSTNEASKAKWSDNKKMLAVTGFVSYTTENISPLTCAFTGKPLWHERYRTEYNYIDIWNINSKGLFENLFEELMKPKSVKTQVSTLQVTDADQNKNKSGCIIQ